MSKTTPAAPAPAAAVALAAAAPAAVDVTPTAGGSYERDPVTGELRRVTATQAPEHLTPNPAFDAHCTGAANAAPAKE